jgi:hypothetical protein
MGMKIIKPVSSQAKSQQEKDDSQDTRVQSLQKAITQLSMTVMALKKEVSK